MIKLFNKFNLKTGLVFFLFVFLLKGGEGLSAKIYVAGHRGLLGFVVMKELKKGVIKMLLQKLLMK